MRVLVALVRVEVLDGEAIALASLALTPAPVADLLSVALVDTADTCEVLCGLPLNDP